MHAALDQHCHQDTTANTFTTLISPLNNVQGESEPIMEFCSQFDSMVTDMLQCKLLLPPILLVVFFLWALHGPYSDLLNQFISHFKFLETASINSVVEDVRYHNTFTLAGPSSCVPKASAANVNLSMATKGLGQHTCGYKHLPY
jgi:hypothetical protein